MLPISKIPLIIFCFGIISSIQSQEVIWEKNFGNQSDEEATAISPTSDGHLIVVGNREMQGEDGTNIDCLLIKVGKNGKPKWQQTIGGPHDDLAFDVLESSDKKIIIAGSKDYQDEASYDAWITCLDEKGKTVWEKRYGKENMDGIQTIIETGENQFTFVGYSFDENNTSRPYLGQINAQGELIWEHYLDRDVSYATSSIVLLENNNFILTGVKTMPSTNRNQVFAIQVDAQGQILWEKTYGVTALNMVNALLPISNNRFLIAGHTNGKGAGSFDAWLLQIDEKGELIWDKTYGDLTTDTIESAFVDKQGHIILGGTKTYRGQISYGWLLKLDQEGKLLEEYKISQQDHAILDICLTKNNKIAFSGLAWDKQLSFDFWIGLFEN